MVRARQARRVRIIHLTGKSALAARGNCMAQEKVAFITGAGKRRVGWHVADALGRRGYSLVIHYNSSAADAESAVQEFTSRGIRAICHQADLANEQQVRDLIGRALQEFGHLDCLVNCAATWKSKRLEEITAADVRGDPARHCRRRRRLDRVSPAARPRAPRRVRPAGTRALRRAAHRPGSGAGRRARGRPRSAAARGEGFQASTRDLAPSASPEVWFTPGRHAVCEDALGDAPLGPHVPSTGRVAAAGVGTVPHPGQEVGGCPGVQGPFPQPV